MRWFSKLFGKKSSPVTEIRDGRSGKLRYQGEGKHAEVYYELSGVPEYELLVWTENLKAWSDGSPITPDEKQAIVAAFQAWAKQQGIRCQWGSA